MFSFVIPRWATLQVQLPTGGASTFVHIGGGRFLSAVPPIAFTGLNPEAPFQMEGIDVTWDGSTLPGDKEAKPCVFGFDLAGAEKAVRAAAERGDTFAQAMLQSFADAEAKFVNAALDGVARDVRPKD